MAAQRFPRTARLLRKREFDRVFGSPLRRSGEFFRGQVAANPDGLTRLGLAIAKRSVPASVDRNRLRRIARETFRVMRIELGPLDYVIGAKPGAGEIDNVRLRDDLARLLRRLAALNPPSPPGTITG